MEKLNQPELPNLKLILLGSLACLGVGFLATKPEWIDNVRERLEE